ncbi:MAG: DUF4209 domain-containing protein [Chloroflexota bacterium]|nr:DUF4209 domain-containing protein [Chloroflexota bacterium]
MTGMRDSYVEDNFEQIVAAFKDCGWKSVFADGSDGHLASKSLALFQAAKEAEKDGEDVRGRALRLVAEACSMTLSSDRPNEPFGPLWQDPQGRSTIPNDFTNSEIEFFAKITDEVDEPTLKGRLADLVWIRGVPRDVRFALLAIDSYTQDSPSPDTWFGDGEKCWNRAISLAHMIRQGAGDRLCNIETSIISAIEISSTDRGFFAFKLARTLECNKLGEPHSTTVAEKLRCLAKAFASAGNHYASGRHYSSAARWYKVSGDKPRSIEMTVAEAESFVSDAHARLASDDPSHAVAAGFLESAIQVYRDVPRAHRDMHNIDDRIQELKLRLSDYGERALDEMMTISSSSIDVTDSIEAARDSVSSKPIHEALRAFVSLSRVSAKELRDLALDSLDRFPLQAFFTTITSSADGRTIAKSPGMSPSKSPDENEEAILAVMSSIYCGTSIGLAVQSCIFPALEVLTQEHRLQTGYFIELARRSPIVPHGRELLFGRALAEGFNRNFDVAIHLLAPQIEHMVRIQLKLAGVSTTHLDRNGIETENGLSALIDLPETEEIFGEDYTYEIRNLFCEALGPNLRNNIAHGLLDDQQASSFETVYAWWFGLKLVINSFWNSLAADSCDESQEQTDDDELNNPADC